VIAGGLFSLASLLLALGLLYDLFALRKGGLRSRLRAGEGESA